MKKYFRIAALFTALLLVFAGCSNGNGNGNGNGPASTETFTVSFNLNGVDGTPQPADQIVEAGKKAARPAQPPQADYYTFAGWFETPVTTEEASTAAPFDFNTAITADKILYAGWTTNYYFVTFHNVDVQFKKEPVSKTGPFTVTAPYPAPSRQGYTFKGWSLTQDPDSSAATVSFPYTVSADVNLYAVWDYNYWVVTFYNGELVHRTQSIAKPSGTLNTPTNLPSKPGHVVKAWSTDPDDETAVVSFPYTVNADLNLYAVWELNSWVVTFYAGETKFDEKFVTKPSGTVSAPSPSPTMPGYRFTGWSAANPPSTLYDFDTVVSADLDLYAAWGPGMTAMELVKDMRLGVNIGNSFDSVSDVAGVVIGQTGWGNPNVSQAYIKSLKTHGFTTVRFPVTWADYIGPAPDYTVNEIWMAQVKRVVDWTLEEDMYCILNVHHDGADINNKSWIEEIRYEEKEAEVKDKFAKLWKQIAVTFNYASDLLVLEGMNEPQYDKLWPRNGTNITDKTRAFKMLTDLNQIFVNTVRATGGNNAYRCLLIPSYWTDIDINVNNWDTFMFMPTDTAVNKLILSFHYYTPWDFCGGNSTTWTNTAGLTTQFDKVKTNFIDKGIPVIIGEYAVNINTNDGAVNGTPKNTANRRAWMLGVTQKCVDMGVCPVLWDTGMRDNNKGMADIERSGQLRISADLAYMIQSVVWP